MKGLRCWYRAESVVTDAEGSVTYWSNLAEPWWRRWPKVAWYRVLTRLGWVDTTTAPTMRKG
mgnify:CR=1 FL=1